MLTGSQLACNFILFILKREVVSNRTSSSTIWYMTLYHLVQKEAQAKGKSHRNARKNGFLAGFRNFVQFVSRDPVQLSKIL